MKKWRKLLSTALCAAMVVSTLPMAWSAQADDTATGTTSVRVEAENYIAKLSTSDAKVSANADASGEKILDNTKNGHVICLGEVDTTGLQSVTMKLANPRASVTFDFYLDGVDEIRKVVSLTTEKTSSNYGDWATFQEYSANVLPSASATALVGLHSVYMTVTVNTAGQTSGGNIDYVDFACIAPEEVADRTVEKQFAADINFDLSDSRITAGGNINNQLVVDGVRVIGSLQTNFVMAYSHVSLENLTSIDIDYAPSSGLKIEVYYGDNMNDMTRIAAPSLGTQLTQEASDAGQKWYQEKNFRVENFTTTTVEGVSDTNLFFKITSDRGNFRMFTLHYAVDEKLIKTDKTINFVDGIDEALSSKPYSLNSKEAGNHFVESTNPGTVLAYSDVSLDGLQSLDFDYSSQPGFKMDILYGLAADTATTIATVTVGTGAWTPFVNSGVVDLNLSTELPENGTLFFKLTSGRCNFKNFTLHYAEDVSGAWEYQAESYSWGASKNTPNWLKTATTNLVESPQNGDVFYLGKADLSDLSFITARVALPTSRGAEGTYTFYADMDVDYANLTSTASGYNRDRYKYTDANQLTGGVQIGQMTVTGVSQTTNDWNTFAHFYTNVDTSVLSEGEHRIYMQVNNTKGNDLGNIDFLRFGGLQKNSIDKTFSFTATVEFAGKYNELIDTKTAASSSELKDLLTNTSAPALGGYVFKSWSEPADHADLLYNAALASGAAVKLTATYEASGDASYHLSGLSDMTAWNGDNSITTETGLSFDTRITVAKAADKGAVAYWVLDGAKVGFGADSYTFYTSGNNNIAVVYVGEAEESVTPSVVLQQSLAPNAGSAYNFSVIAQTSIPNDASVSEYGVIYAASKEALEAVRNGEQANTITVTSSKTGKNVQYMTHLLQVKAGKTRFAMAYAVVTVGGEQQTVYSAQYATVTTPSSGAATPTINAF